MRLPLALLLAVACAGLAACGSSGPDASRERPEIVVTTGILGAVVSDVVGDAATVEVLMPAGVDPHEWSPSARDIERVDHANLVVANGLDLEESLAAALEQAASDGVPIFRAGEHVQVRVVGAGEATGEHGAGSDDPHLWTSPRAMRDVVLALGPAITAATGLDVAAGTAAEAAALERLDAEVEGILAPIPAERRRLVTGHESLGYFADRYGFELVGAVIPSLSSQAEASAADLAALEEKIRASGVTTVFTEVGTPRQVADAIADETGARVVELPSHALPEDGTYATFMRELATGVADGLVS